MKMATFSIQIEEVVEEKRKGGEAVGDDLGVDLGCMSDVFGFGGCVEECIEMGW